MCVGITIIKWDNTCHSQTHGTEPPVHFCCSHYISPCFLSTPPFHSLPLSLSWAPSRPSWVPDPSSFCWSTAFTLGLDMSCSSTLEAPSPPSSSPSLQCPDLLHNKVETETNIGVTLCKGEMYCNGLYQVHVLRVDPEVGMISRQKTTLETQWIYMNLLIKSNKSIYDMINQYSYTPLLREARNELSVFPWKMPKAGSF